MKINKNLESIIENWVSGYETYDQEIDDDEFKLFCFCLNVRCYQFEENYIFLKEEINEIDQKILLFETTDSLEKDIYNVYSIYLDEYYSFKNICDFSKKICDYLSLSKETYEGKNIELTIFIGEKIKKLENSVREQLILENDFLEKINIKFIDINSEIYQEYLDIESSKTCVKEFIFNIDDGENFLNSPNNDIKSIVVNISSLSIKKLYEKSGKNNGPLYHSNLRYYIKNKKVDIDIEKSIKDDKEIFWFLNNGIVIVCSSFEIKKDENQIILHDFSFVNGGQTTHIIGTTENLENFYVLTKIIATDSSKVLSSEKDKNDFIEKISVATNKQKAINDKDLLANSSEISSLSKKFKEYDPPLFLQVKRGQKISDNFKGPSNVAKIFKIDDVFQNYSAFNFQMPGTTKSSKSKIMNNDFKNKIFKIMDVNHLYQVNILKKNLLEIAKKKRKKSSSFATYYQTGVWFILSFINLYLKSIYSIDELIKIFSNWDKEKNLENFSDDFNCIYPSKILKVKINDSSFKNNLNQLAEDIVVKISNRFDLLRQNDESLFFSNFSKIDKNYLETAYSVLKIIKDSDTQKDSIKNLISNIIEV